MANAKQRRVGNVTFLHEIKTQKQQTKDQAQQALIELLDELKLHATRGELTGIFGCFEIGGRKLVGASGTLRDDLPALALSSTRLQQWYLKHLEACDG